MLRKNSKLSKYQRLQLKELANGKLLSPLTHAKVHLHTHSKPAVQSGEYVDFYDEKPMPELNPFDDPIPF